MKKAEQITSMTEAQEYVEGCLNDFEEGEMTKDEFMSKMFEYSTTMARFAQPYLLGHFKQIMSAEFENELKKKRFTDSDKDKEFTSHLGDCFTNIEMSVKSKLKLKS